MKIVSRYLMCLLLVGCIVVGLSPVRASALAADDASNIAVPGDLAVSSALIALGVSPGSSDADFDALVASVLSSAEFESYIREGKLSFVKYTGTEDLVCYAVSLDFLNLLHGWLYDTGVISCVYSPGFGSHVTANTLVQIRDDGTSIYGNSDFVFCPMTTSNFPSIDNCVGYAVSTDASFMIYNQSNVAVATKASGFSYNGNQYYYVSWNKNNDLVNPFDAFANGIDPYVGMYKAIDGEMDLSSTSFGSSNDLHLGVIAMAGDELSGVYTNWAAAGVSIDGGETVYWPLALAADVDSVKSLSQEDMQLGAASYVDGVPVEPDMTEPSTEPSDPVPGTEPGADSPNRYVDAVSSDFLEGILSEIIDTLPVIIPVSIAVVGITKGIDFLISVIKRG